LKDDKYKPMAILLTYTLDILMTFGGIALIFILYKTFSSITEGNRLKYIFNSLIFFTGTSLLLAILYELRAILKSVIKAGPFTMKNVKALNLIAVFSFMITICYLINYFYNNQFKSFQIISIDATGIHTDTEFLIFFFAGSLILILAKVYKIAVEVKEENDFTI